jgi:hypothetical protein
MCIACYDCELCYACQRRQGAGVKHGEVVLQPLQKPKENVLEEREESIFSSGYLNI